MTRTAAVVLNLVCVLGSMSASAIETQLDSRSRADTPRRQIVECDPALAERCPDDSLFRQLPELMTPPDSGGAESPHLESSPYRELEVLPQLKIIPGPPPTRMTSCSSATQAIRDEMPRGVEGSGSARGILGCFDPINQVGETRWIAYCPR
jgi:hypothetical protein